MAISYLGVSFQSRSKGHKAVAGAAYRAGEKLHDERYDMDHDYVNRGDVQYSGIMLPEGADSRFLDREFLWNTVEHTEKRKDSQVAIDYILALPKELSLDYQVELARNFARYHFVDKGLIVDVAVHDKGDGNPHAHLYTTTRRFLGDRFDRLKARDLMPKIRNGLLIPEEEHIWNEKYRAFQDQYFKAKGLFLEVDSNHLISMKHEGRINTQSEAHYARDENEIRKELCVEIALKDPASLLNILGSEQAVFNDRVIAKTINRYSKTTEEFQLAMAKVFAHPDCVALGIDTAGREAYTTRANYRREADMADKAFTLLTRSDHAVSSSFVKNVMAKYPLSEEQQTALTHLVNGGDISALVGRAGSGKSYLMKATKEVWESQGYRVSGVAVSGIAAKNLSDETGMPTSTLYRFKQQFLYGKEEVLSKNDVLIVDEAGMVDVQDMANLVDICHATGAKLVLVGDPDQLQPVGPGAPFRALAARVGFVSMDEIRRQKDIEDRKASVALSQGRVDQALDHYSERKALHFIDDVEDRSVSYQSMVTDWFASLDMNAPSSQLMLAHRNVDVQALNLLAREQLIQAGHLAKKGTTVIAKRNEKEVTLSLVPGDRLVFLRNNAALDVKNGQFGSVLSIKGDVITVHCDGQAAPFSFSTADYADFDYGYAATVHKTQGVTLDRTFVYAGGGGWNRHLAYVALTRHRENVKLYASSLDHADLSALKNNLSRDEYRDNVLDFPLSYAERRGFDPDSLLGRFIERVVGTKEKIQNAWLFVTNYEAFLLQKAQQHRDHTKSRQLAKTTATYIDAIRALNKARFELAKELPRKALYADLRYTDLFEQQLVLNKQAHALWPERESLSVVFARNQFSLEKLEAATLAHERYLRVERYCAAYENGNASLRCRNAIAIQENVRAHFTNLSYLSAKKGLSLPDIQRQLKQDAQSVARTRQLHGLSLDEKQHFITVERYLAVQSELKSVWRKALYERDDQLCPREQATVTALTTQQDRFANLITEMPEHYRQGLEFYGLDTNKLTTQSVRHSRRETIKQLNRSIALEERRKLAHTVLQDRAYYSLIHEQGADWKELNRLSRAHLHDQFLQNLTPEKRIAYERLEAYQHARVETAKAWAVYFDLREKGRPSLAPALKQCRQLTQKRNALAHALVLDQTTSAEFVERTRLPLADIRKHAKYHRDELLKTQRPSTNIEKTNVLERPVILDDKTIDAGFISIEEWTRVKEYLHPAFGKLASSHALLQHDNDPITRANLERGYHQSMETIYKDDRLSADLQRIAPSVAKQVTDYGKSVPGLKIDWQSPALQAEAQKLNASDQPEAKGLATAIIQANKETDPNMKKMTLQLLNEKVRRLVNDKTALAEISTKAPLLAKQMQAYHAREKERDRSIDR